MKRKFLAQVHRLSVTPFAFIDSNATSQLQGIIKAIEDLAIDAEQCEPLLRSQAKFVIAAFVAILRNAVFSGKTIVVPGLGAFRQHTVDSVKYKFFANLKPRKQLKMRAIKSSRQSMDGVDE